MSDQSIVRTVDGQHVVVTVHGGGIYSRPERLEQTFLMDQQSMTGQYAGRLSPNEVSGLLAGRLPDGAAIPVYTYEHFRAIEADGLPDRYGVVMEFNMAKASPRGYVNVSDLRDDPLFVVHAGGAKVANDYLYKVATRSKVVGNWPPFDSIYWDEAQSRVLFLAEDGGVLGTNGVVNTGRYVAVVPTKASASLRGEDFGLAA